jgi:hypothetical protein
VEGNVGLEEIAEDLLAERAPDWPVADRVEEQLRATVRVLLPAVDLVLSRERNALLELVVGVGRPADGIASVQNPNRAVKVLRHVACGTKTGQLGKRRDRANRRSVRTFGPDLLATVRLLGSDLLQSAPADEGIVTDEGGD